MTARQKAWTGTLCDSQILSLAKESSLICENFDEAFIKGACYELRAGNTYYELDGADSKNHPTRHKLEPNEYILIKPKQFITVICHEKLMIPDDIIGRVLTKGKLFSIGIIPVNTYADPGFEGNLGIVLANLSNNYLKIMQLEPIAKIEFSKLSSPVNRSYKGQHGYDSKMWPIPYEMILSQEEIKKDSRIKEPLEELKSSHGVLVSNALLCVYKYNRRLILAAISYVSFSCIILAILAWRQDNGFTYSSIASIVIGVASNVLFSLLVNFSTSLKRLQDTFMNKTE